MQIKAKIIQHSISHYTGKEIITYELEYPRYIHAEFMTHRVFSRNAASSRAIPAEAMQRQILEHNVEFVHYGKNQPGMQAKEELEDNSKETVRIAWHSAKEYSIQMYKAMVEVGAAKQVANRLLEPWMMMKTVMTTTELANWDWLRNHEDAQPEIKALAEVMHVAYQESNPYELWRDEWHVPYVTRVRSPETGDLQYWSNQKEISLEDARIISASCCAQVSYRKNDDSIEKAKNIFDRLVSSAPVHASPTEHQASPIDYDFHMPEGMPTDLDWTWAQGITAYHMDGSLGSGNFRDWIQFRQLIPNNVMY